MNYIGKFITNFKEFYNEINSATLTGAIDVVVIKQADQTYLCSPFHVRFGKLGVLRSKEKVVDIEINGEPVEIHMKLGDNGEAFFVEELQEGDDAFNLPMYLATSPIPDSNIATAITNELNRLKVKKVKSWTEMSSDSNFKRDFPDGKSSKLLELQQVPHQRLNPDLFLVDGVKARLDVMSNLNSNSVGNLSSKRRRRRRAAASRTPTPAKTTDDLFEDTPLDELSLYDDEYVVHSDDYNEDERGSLHDELERFKASLPRSSSRPISRTYTPPASNSATGSALAISSVAASMSIDSNVHSSIKSIPNDFHPFSDGEVTPFPSGSPKKQFDRPPSPKSDTEFEMSKADDAVAAAVAAAAQTADSQAEVSWQWGELPQVSRKVSAASQRSNQSNELHLPDHGSSERKVSPPIETRAGVLHNMLTLLKKEEKANHEKSNVAEEGMFLDDLDLQQLDPETADLYFPRLRSSMPLKRVSDDETESGQGSSIPHSPPSTNDLELESRIQIELNRSPIDLNSNDPTSATKSETIANGDLVDSSNRTDNTDQTLGDLVGCWPQIQLSLCGDETSELKFNEALVSFEQFSQDPADVLKNPNLVCRINGKCHPWSVAACALTSLLAYKQPLPETCMEALSDSHNQTQKKVIQNKGSSWWSWRRTQAETSPNSKNQGLSPSSKQSPIDSDRITRIQVANDSSETDNEADDASFGSRDNARKTHYRKVLRLTSSDIERLNLQEGSNEAVFSVTTAYQGTTRCKCHVYLWNFDDKIIISDIDGTITKSDVLGHILPILGKDWAQSGVANLFTKIKDNGYKLLYLSARAIGQAKITREYLKSVRQGDLCLPDGPLLLSPTSLISAFHKEVFEKKPEEFKISCLKDILALFPENPFYAGFGNKINVSPRVLPNSLIIL
jgi:phosphatidate phosphatase LPIN